MKIFDRSSYNLIISYNIINFQSSVTKAPALSQSGPASGIRRNPHTLSRQSIGTCAQRENFFSRRIIPC